MTYLDPIDDAATEFGDLYDELPLWSAPFGMALLDRVPLRRDLTVADLGAGTGFLTLELAERCGNASTVYAIDPWSAGMARLRRRVAQRQLDNVVLLEEDAKHISIPDMSIDLLISNLGVNNFDDPHAVVRECHRIARAGATFLLTTNLVGHMAEFYDVFRDVLIESGQHDRIAMLEAHIAHRATVDSIDTLLRAGGFEVVDVATDSFRWRFANGSALLRHFFIRLGFLPAWKTIPSAGTVDEIFARLERELNSFAEAHGEISLTIPMACITARKRGSD